MRSLSRGSLRIVVYLKIHDDLSRFKVNFATESTDD